MLAEKINRRIKPLGIDKVNADSISPNQPHGKKRNRKNEKTIYTSKIRKVERVYIG